MSLFNTIRTIGLQIQWHNTILIAHYGMLRLLPLKGHDRHCVIYGALCPSRCSLDATEIEPSPLFAHCIKGITRFK